MKRVLKVILVAVSFVLVCSGTGFSMSDAELMKKFPDRRFYILDSNSIRTITAQ